ncbi:MAG: DUF1045 domain-containing protein [Rhodocyclaceae bacterium]
MFETNSSLDLQKQMAERQSDTAGASSNARYAIFYSPEPGSPLDDLGSHWVGRDAMIGIPLPQPEVAGIPPSQLEALTEAPRHYGLHATIKSPFRLKSSESVQDLIAALESFASTQAAVSIPLTLHEREGLIALRPAAPSAALSALAWDCVRSLDNFRQPMSEREMNRRAVGFTRRQRELLEAWGTAQVDDLFRFHITLCARASAVESAAILHFLQQYLAPVCAAPLAIDNLCLFEERDNEPMRCRARFRLGGG